MLKNIDKNLNSTILWCAERLDKSNLASCHRSEEIFPRKVSGPDDWAINYSEGDALTGVIDHVIEQKNLRLPSSVASLKKKGRILCFYPDLSLNDAMVAVECALQMDPRVTRVHLTRRISILMRMTIHHGILGFIMVRITATLHFTHGLAQKW